MHVVRQIISWIALLVAVYCLIAFVLSIARALALIHTHPAYALGMMIGPLITGIVFFLIYRWGKRSRK
jgi:hypothetical protein